MRRMGAEGLGSFVLGLRRRGGLLAMLMIGKAMFASEVRYQGFMYKALNELFVTVCYEGLCFENNQ